jgi:hypothetical protein
MIAEKFTRLIDIIMVDGSIGEVGRQLVRWIIRG